MLWPPQLEDVRRELGRKPTDTDDDAVLQARLDAAVDYVEDARAGDFNFTGSATSLLPPPPPRVWQGTVELTLRWMSRRSSPDGLVDMGELGTARIPTVDPDIERKLGVGRWRAPMVG